MELLARIISGIDSFIWGLPLIVFLLGTHLFLNIRLRFIQRYIWTAIKLSVTKDSAIR